MDRDYPDPERLAHLFEMLDGNTRSSESVRRRLGWDDDEFQTALEKLWIHGGAKVDPEENVTRGEAGWRRPYRKQRDHRQDQLEKIFRFAEHPACRMLTLVQHFGDEEDSGEPCGMCDTCAPNDGIVARFRDVNDEEIAVMERILDILAHDNGVAKGRLFKEVMPEKSDRGWFEEIVSGLERARLVTRQEDSFEKNGRKIPYVRLHLTADGKRRQQGGGSSIRTVRMAEGSDQFEPEKPRRRRGKGRKRQDDGLAAVEAPAALVEALKTWRLAEAKKRNTPAFRVLTNRTLGGIAGAQPTCDGELLGVPGFGPGLLKKYGKAILTVVKDNG